tara:strand:+ start:3967 stop:4506 length:540 start_codon:yes stop_codon:yes gene_type:complete
MPLSHVRQQTTGSNIAIFYFRIRQFLPFERQMMKSIKPGITVVISCLLCSLFFSAAGCSGKSDQLPTAEVSGKITFEGEPLQRGTIVFFPESGKRNATGEIKEDGTYTLTTYENGDGAFPGAHTVTIISERDMTNLMPEDVKPGEKNWLIPPKYNQSKTSGLTATVKENEANEINFDLK